MISIFITLSFLLSLLMPVLSLWLLPIPILLAWYIFHDSMNLVQNAGRVYWVVRDVGKKGVPFISRAFMRQTDYPWLVGSGVQFRVWKYTFQIGICHPQEAVSEDEGILRAVDGHYMTSAPKEIRKWH